MGKNKGQTADPPLGGLEQRWFPLYIPFGCGCEAVPTELGYCGQCKSSVWVVLGCGCTQAMSC